MKDLLAIVAFVAVISWCAGEVGSDNPLFWGSLAGSVLMSGLWVAAARSQYLRWLTLGAPAAPFCGFLGTFIISPALLNNSLLLLVAGLVLLFLPRQPMRRLAAIAMVCSMGSFVYGIYSGADYATELDVLREEFPVESLADRLAYERNRNFEMHPTRPSGTALSQKVKKQLTATDDEYQYGDWRSYMLKAIHSEYHERFIRASGFGVTRMDLPRGEFVRLPPLIDVAFDAPPTVDERCGFDRPPKPARSAKSIHQASRRDFVGSDRLGAVEQVDRVIGFRAHALTESPLSDLSEPYAWTIERLELVSLLKFDEPRVYVLDHLPRMDQLSSDDIPTRGLTEFERKALASLWADEDIVIAEEGANTLMLGSLRAGKACLGCHSVKRGELLGAFTYVLRQVGEGSSESVEGGEDAAPPGAPTADL
jgi:hypothetical protein